MLYNCPCPPKNKIVIKPEKNLAQLEQQLADFGGSGIDTTDSRNGAFLSYVVFP